MMEAAALPYTGEGHKVSTDVSAVSSEGMVRKTAQGEHLSENGQIIVHNGTSFVMKCQGRENRTLPREADG